MPAYRSEMDPDYLHLSHEFLVTLTGMPKKTKEKMLSTLYFSHKDLLYLIKNNRCLEDIKMVHSLFPKVWYATQGFDEHKPLLESLCASRGRLDIAEHLDLVPSLQSALNACMGCHLPYVKWCISKGLKINFNMRLSPLYCLSRSNEKICECIDYVVLSGQYIPFTVSDSTPGYMIEKIEDLHIPVDNQEKFAQRKEMTKGGV